MKTTCVSSEQDCLTVGLGKLQAIRFIFDELCNDKEWKVSVHDFLNKSENATRWMIYSDYCLDDENKSNDVMSFVLMPYLDEEKYQEIDCTIKDLQPSDIKKVRTVNSEFLMYLKSLPILSFNFIVDNRKLLFGDTGDERLKTVLDFLGLINNQFETWIKNASKAHPLDYYKSSVKKISDCIRELSERKNCKLMQDIILIAFLGTLYSSKILQELPSNIEIVGWFPDRDKSNNAYDNIIMDIFNVLFYNQIPDCNIKFAFSGSETAIVPFYDNENRIVDYICGTLADYNLDEDFVTKDKFSIVLQRFFADNSSCHIYRIKSQEDPLKIGRIVLKSHLEE